LTQIKLQAISSDVIDLEQARKRRERPPAARERTIAGIRKDLENGSPIHLLNVMVLAELSLLKWQNGFVAK